MCVIAYRETEQLLIIYVYVVMWLEANIKLSEGKKLNVLKAEKSTQINSLEQLEPFPLSYILDYLAG